MCDNISSYFLIDLLESSKDNINLYHYSFCLKHKNYNDEDLYKKIFKINYNFKNLNSIKNYIFLLYPSRQIFALIFEKERFPCQRFEVGNNINKEVYITISDKTLKEFLGECKEDESHTLYVYLNNYPAPRIIKHGKYYDEISVYSTKEDKSNRYNFSLKYINKELIKFTQKYLDDNYNLIK